MATTCNDFECAARSVGFPLRPGHVASRRAQRNSLSRFLASTSLRSCARLRLRDYPPLRFGAFPERAAHNCTCRLSYYRAETEGRIRLLRRCRRACATCPGIGVKPSFWLRSKSRYKSSRQRRSKNNSITFVVRAKNGTPQNMRDGGEPLVRFHTVYTVSCVSCISWFKIMLC